MIADRLGVAQSVISELLARRGPLPAQPALPEPEPAQPTAPNAEDAQASTAEPGATEPGATEPVDGEPGAALTGTSRVSTGTFSCRYAGAMLLHAYLDRVDAQAIFATLAGGPARRYDDLGVLSTATLGFALGIDTVEGAKHLRRGEAGAALGLVAVPELKTLRARLGALADGSDPLAIQRAFAARMLAADPAADPVYFVDDHFVPYAGARPVGKGWNTKRRHAQPGRDDTLLVDARGRAVVFGSGEPTGLSTSLPGVLAQLRAVIGPDAPVLLGFDRGGAYPVVFTACRDAGAHWVTYRRAPLVQVSATPRRSWTVRDGKRITVVLVPRPATLALCGDTPPMVPDVTGVTSEAGVVSFRCDVGSGDGRAGSGPRDQQRRGQPAAADRAAQLRVGGDVAAGADGAAVGAGHGRGRDREGHVHQRGPGPGRDPQLQRDGFDSLRPEVRRWSAADVHAEQRAADQDRSRWPARPITGCRSRPGACPSWPTTWSPRGWSTTSATRACGCCCARRASPFKAVKTWKTSNDPDFEAKKNRVLELYEIADGKTTPGEGDPTW